MPFAAPCCDAAPRCVVCSFSAKIFLVVSSSNRCLAVVVVLSPDFVRKRCPMLELETLLKRDRSSFCLLPVWHGITYQQCVELETGYTHDPWVGNEEKPDLETLERWAGTVKQLLDTVMIRDNKVSKAWATWNNPLLARCSCTALLSTSTRASVSCISAFGDAARQLQSPHSFCCTGCGY